MKRAKALLSLLLVLCLSLGLFACAAPAADTTPSPTAGADADTTPDPQESAEPLSFTAGTYTGTGRGNNGDITVSVTFSDTAITDITVTDHKETSGVGTIAIERLPANILEHQSLGVDAIAGATNTSEGILAAVEDCANQAGGNIDALKVPVPTPEAPEIGQNDVKVDVVVVGAGVSGLRAALLAAESGKSVALLEKLPFVGGNALLSAGIIQAAGTTVQEEYGITGDSPEAFMESLIDPASPYATDNPELTTIMHQGGRDAVNDLSARGLEFVGFNDASIRWHVIAPEMRKGGPTLINLLMDECNKAGVTTYMETAGTELIMQDGMVAGVKATNADGEQVFYADAVILTTGGFASSGEMVAEYFPDLEGTRSNAGAGAIGDGIRMAQAIGAAVRGMDSGIQMSTASALNNVVVGITMNFAPAILVNTDGDRFIPESMNYGPAAREIAQTEDQTAYLVFDDIIMEAVPQLKDLVNRGGAVDADSIEALADAIGTANLPATLAHYNEMAKAGEDTDLGRTTHLQEITGSHFYAVELYPYVYNTYGGLAIDTSAHVLDTNGQPIPRLYSAGEVTGSPEVQEGFVYTSGIAQGLAFAKVAVDSILAEVK